MNLVVVLIGVCAVSPLYSFIISESQDVKINHRYEELKTEKLSEKVFGYNFEFVQADLNIGKEDRKFEVCHDKKENLVYFLAFEQQNDGKLLGLFVADMKANKIYKMIISFSNDKQDVKISKIWCSHGSLYGFDDQTDHLFMKLSRDEQFKAFYVNDKLEDIYFDESEKNNVALLTRSKNLFIFNVMSNKWEMISGDASNPKLTHSLETNQTIYIQKDFITYGRAKDLVWLHYSVSSILIKFQMFIGMKFFVSGKWISRLVDMVQDVYFI
ncbi:hypothetical protein RF11_14646 [Thelohanellus kitauei]|uniref:Uncharacterized protein n=1 Tax=Thelohanellus kitauei TaxID=669202 RepID=A0A0C2MQU0_THEKT|nr:hypothetical protein RF11_14646 [Thelohanellus kitauei]